MPGKSSILVVDDEVQILRVLKRKLELEGYNVITAANGKLALEKISDEMLDLVILDIMMPGIDGYTVCQRIREFSQVPIIMVTAKGSDDEKVKGFKCGADDYVTKPFSLKELVSRVEAVLRRSQNSGEIDVTPGYCQGDLEIDFIKRKITLAGQTINFTPTEYNLIKELVLNRGKVLTHSYLLQKVWGAEYRDENEYLHVFISRLRNKLHLDSPERKYILTVPGVGYQFSE